MHRQRTGSIIAVGILNIVLGLLGVAGASLMVLGGGVLAAASETDFAAQFQEGFSVALDQELNAGNITIEEYDLAQMQLAEGVPAAKSMGWMVVGIGLITLVMSLVLAFSGIGILRVAPWGRILGIVCGATIAILQVLAIVTGNIGIMTFVQLGYGLFLCGICCSIQWIRAFSPAPPQDSIEILDQPEMPAMFRAAGETERDAA